MKLAPAALLRTPVSRAFASILRCVCVAIVAREGGSSLAKGIWLAAITVKFSKGRLTGIHVGTGMLT